ncbi:MAG: DUF2079 domain-containing protein [Eubacteriales bacterium]|nr:DUF2079 domain-containing protein [Eubacteriales bacterium]
MRTKNLNLRPRHFQRLELIGPIIVFTLGLIYAGILASNMVRRSNYFQASTFDMGLFVQMFHNMARGQGPICTLERDQLLSHLQVHMSPIFYLMLPGFCLSRTGANLQIQQILVFVSGIIPIILIARKLEISLHLQLCFSALYLLNPAIFMSSFYDLHENVFLAPLLLWLLYAIFSERLWMILVTSVLCLLVKEDAGLYVICIGLYALCRPSHRSIRYKWVLAGIDILLPMLYFITVILYLQNFGDGAMLNRFNNLLLPGESGITAMMKNLLLNPTYALAGCFRPAEFFFLLVSLLSLAFFPLLQRYWYNFLLFLPFVVINLLSDYPYQHMLGFQYNYGSQTLLIVMVLLSFAEAFPKRPRYHFIRHTALVFGLVFSLFFTGYTLNDASTATMRQAESRRPMRSELNRLVGTWDSSLSTLTSAFLTSDLAHFPHLYELGKHQNIESSPAIEQIIVWEDLCDDLERLHLESLLQSGDFILEPTQSGEFFKVYRHK